MVRGADLEQDLSQAGFDLGDFRHATMAPVHNPQERQVSSIILLMAMAMRNICWSDL